MNFLELRAYPALDLPDGIYQARRDRERRQLGSLTKQYLKGKIELKEYHIFIDIIDTTSTQATRRMLISMTKSPILE